MSELRWSGGERCREGDAVQWPECSSIRYECTAIGSEKVLLKDKDGEEFGLLSKDYILRRRAGEAEDRDRERYEYHEGEPPAFYERWEAIAGGDTLQFRRLRPPPAPAKRRMKANLQLYSGTYHGQVHDEDAECRFNPACQPVEPPPAPPKPRRMLGNPQCCKADPHSREHDETPACAAEKLACEPVDPPAPAFEAVVREVTVGTDGVCRLAGCNWAAYVGAGAKDGYTVAAFCETQEDAERIAGHYRVHGGLRCSVFCYPYPMMDGRTLPFSVAVKVTK